MFSNDILKNIFIILFFVVHIIEMYLLKLKDTSNYFQQQKKSKIKITMILNQIKIIKNKYHIKLKFNNILFNNLFIYKMTLYFTRNITGKKSINIKFDIFI